MRRAASAALSCGLLLAGCGGGGGGGGGAAGEAAGAGTVIRSVDDWWKNLRSRNLSTVTPGAAVLRVPALQPSEQITARVVQSSVKKAVCAGAASIAQGPLGQQSEADRNAWRELARSHVQGLYALYPAGLVDSLADGIGDWLFGQTDPVAAGNVCKILERSGL